MKRRTRQLKIESLECRRMFARVAGLDFDGDTLSAADMQEGRWGSEAVTVNGFRDLFNANAPSFMDFNDDGQVGNADYLIAKDQIMAEVRRDFAPYALDVVDGQQDALQSLFDNNQIGDVIVMVTGETSGLFPIEEPDPALMGRVAGQANIDDFTNNANGELTATNNHDDIVWVYGGVIKEVLGTMPDTTPERFVKTVAWTISHEMGHSFGLWHVDTVPANPINATSPQAMMSYHYAEDDLESGFQDIDYEFVGYTQNAHRILSRPDVLGSSENAWIASLRPGELTVHGYENVGSEIRFKNLGPATWEVTIYNPIVPTINEQFNIAEVGPFNLFRQVITQINVFGGSKNDLITVESTTPTAFVVHGGRGNDVIKTAAGRDKLFGDDGDDWLFGGDESDDLWGGFGSDHLYGEDGDDDLYEMSDYSIDYLFGGRGNDTFWLADPNPIPLPGVPFSPKTTDPGNFIKDWTRGDRLIYMPW